MFANPVRGRHAHHPMLRIGHHEQRIFTLTASDRAVLRTMNMKARSAVHALRMGVQERVQQLQQNQNQTQQGCAFSFNHF